MGSAVLHALDLLREVDLHFRVGAVMLCSIVAVNEALGASDSCAYLPLLVLPCACFWYFFGTFWVFPYANILLYSSLCITCSVLFNNIFSPSVSRLLLVLSWNFIVSLFRAYCSRQDGSAGR